MDLTTDPPEAPEAIVFRPSKKRKIYRQRALEDGPNPTSSSPPDPTPNLYPVLALAETNDDFPVNEELEGTRVSMSEILRLRKLRKHRVGGVEFRASTMSGGGDNGQEGAIVLHESTKADNEKDKVQKGDGVVRRFAKQTGMIGDVDKHMMTYIDSELAKRHLTTITSSRMSYEADHTAHYPDSNPSVSTAQPNKSLEKQPATLGKLLEIDLGSEARDRNVVRTEQARRKLDGEDVDDDSNPEATSKKKKPRLGRDGKPYRDRKRRTSEDMRRDKLVEEVLRENRLELYEEAPAPTTTTAGDGEADDQIAEAFRREFLDAVSQRQRKKAVPTSGASGSRAKKEEELVVKGPKLGGSRSARAAMREVQLKEAKEAAKAGRK